jgi:hypothetical protein
MINNLSYAINYVIEVGSEVGASGEYRYLGTRDRAHLARILGADSWANLDQDICDQLIREFDQAYDDNHTGRF